jgi:hypothetical protein
MTKDELKVVKQNATFLNTIGSQPSVKNQMEENLKGALVGGGVGVLIAIVSKRNLFLYGIVGLIVGRILFKAQQK